MDHDAAAAFRAGPRHRDRHELMRRGRCVSSRHMRCQCPIALVYSTTLSVHARIESAHQQASRLAREMLSLTQLVSLSRERYTTIFILFLFFSSVLNTELITLHQIL